VLFNASDSNSLGSMWVTDGVTSGTSALTISPLSDLFQFDFPGPDFTVLGTDAVFEANATGLAGLWVTNGTSAGTSELTPAGAPSLSGTPFFFSSSTLPDFTVLGSKALFDGEDSNGHFNLWVTDGTSAGTSEVIFSGADSNGLFIDDGDNPDFSVLGGNALFSGVDASDHLNLWVIDGTSAGTREIVAVGASASRH